MRSTRKEIDALISEARKELGFRTNAETWNYVYDAGKRLKRRIESRYDVSGVTLSPYRGGHWTLSCFDSVGCQPGQVRCPSMHIDFEDWADRRTETIQRFAEIFALEPKAH